MSAEGSQFEIKSRLIYWVAISLLGIDRVAKAYAWVGITSKPNSWFSFELFRNEGIAFSIPVPDLIFWPLAVIIFAGLLYMFFATRKTDGKKAAIIFLIILGAVSNLFDKAMFGHIMDYFIFFDRSAINIADIMIMGGVIGAIMRKEPSVVEPVAPSPPTPEQANQR